MLKCLSEIWKNLLTKDHDVRDETTHERVKTVLEDVYRRESRRVYATLVRLLRDFDLAEEAMHEAFASAVEQWTSDGIPENPRA